MLDLILSVQSLHWHDKDGQDHLILFGKYPHNENTTLKKGVDFEELSEEVRSATKKY